MRAVLAARRTPRAIQCVTEGCMTSSSFAFGVCVCAVIVGCGSAPSDDAFSTPSAVAFNCPRNAGCDLSCTATSSCSNVNVVCSDGACGAGCPGFASGPVHVECGASCACDDKCK